jgi:hypothetical protein
LHLQRNRVAAEEVAEKIRLRMEVSELGWVQQERRFRKGKYVSLLADGFDDDHILLKVLMMLNASSINRRPFRPFLWNGQCLELRLSQGRAGLWYEVEVTVAIMPNPDAEIATAVAR